VGQLTHESGVWASGASSDYDLFFRPDAQLDRRRSTDVARGLRRLSSMRENALSRRDEMARSARLRE
jgi:hypothetical protein